MTGFDYVKMDGCDISDILTQASKDAFSRISFTFLKEHLESLVKAFNSKYASDNDKFVIASLLKNAAISAKGKLPLCQDTGIANIFGWNSDGFSLKGKKSAVEAITEGTKDVYLNRNLRFSSNSPLNFYEEKDPKNNMPPQITIFNEDGCLAPMISENFEKKCGEKGLSLVFCAKGGGSSNKTTFIQGTKANVNPAAFEKLLIENIKKIGTSACPPYNLAVVCGGLSPEQNLLALKLATCGAYDKMTYEPNDFGFRSKEIEDLSMKIASETGYGAQFGGKIFALGATAIRLPRHGASFPISIGVSCSAHRNLKVFVTKNGYYIEQTVTDVEKIEGYRECEKYLEKDSVSSSESSASSIEINTDDGMEEILKILSDLKPGTRISLSGKLLVARDKAHAQWKKNFEEQNGLPEYTKKYPVCYAGPAETPEGYAIGSFGPTTAGRMDSYAEFLMSRGASLVTLAKGNRSKEFIEACKKHKAVYLGAPGGIAALNAEKYIIDQKVIDFEEFGMEAARLITVKNLPCFILTNGNGEDFYSK